MSAPFGREGAPVHTERRAFVGTTIATVAIGAGILAAIEPDSVRRGVRWIRGK